jgi:cation diffusion facilitator family transporter
MTSPERAIKLNLLLALFMVVGKMGAYSLTGSVAIFSDWAESCMHLFATGICTVCYWYARRPADDNHPYGHEKIVYFSSAAEGMFLLFAAVSVAGIVVHALFDEASAVQLEEGAAIIATLALISGLFGRYLVRVGDEHHQQILTSHGRHLLADMWTSLGIAGGVFLVAITDFHYLDIVIASLVAVHLSWTAVRLLKEAFEGLMEKGDSAAETLLVQQLERAISADLISGYHALTHRVCNDRLWVEVHLTFPSAMPLHEVHDRACRLEISIDRSFPKRRVWLTTHFEPEEHEKHHPPEHFEFIKRTREKKRAA